MVSWIRKQVGQIAVGWPAMAVKAVLSPAVLGAGAMIFDRDGKVLLARHSYKPGWSFPGGGIKRGEAPADGILRELQEEMGVVRADPPELFSVYSGKIGWITNVVFLFRFRNAEVEFRRNLEVREIRFADPSDLPDDTSAGTQRRLAEHLGQAPISPFW
ncbi:MAG: NUDIX domain-containing protein [Proteobacteria bacterium]|nr:NUDIX domain-containing protein [Pseudomonadota bacterium]